MHTIITDFVRADPALLASAGKTDVRLERTIYDGANVAIEFVVAYFRGDRFDYHMTLTR